MPMLRVFMPKLTEADIHAMRGGSPPHVTRINVPRDAVFLGCQPIPTLVDLYRMTSPGGPAGYGYWIPDESAPVAPRLLMHVEPERSYGKTLDFPGVKVHPVGMAMFKGMLLGHLELWGADMPALEASMKSAGFLVFDSHAYRIPDEFKQTLLTNQEAEAKFAAALRERGVGGGSPPG